MAYPYTKIIVLTGFDEFEFAKKMTAEFGVAVIPVSAFYAKKTNQKIVRICFAKTENLLTEAAELLCKI